MDGMINMSRDKIVDAGKALVIARRSAKKTRQKIDQARSAIHACAGDQDLRGLGVQYNRLGEILATLDEAMKVESLVMQAHGSAAALLCDCEIDLPTDDEIVVLGGGGGR